MQNDISKNQSRFRTLEEEAEVEYIRLMKVMKSSETNETQLWPSHSLWPEILVG